MRERMLAGDLYRGADPELEAEMRQAMVLTKAINDSDPREPEKRQELLRQLLGSLGTDVEIRPPLHVDYGSHLFVGDRTFINFGLMALDVAEIRIGRMPLANLGGQSLAVAKDSDHRAEAIRAVHFLTDIPAQKLLTSFGFAPTGVDAYIDAALQQALPHLSLIRNAIEGSRPRPAHANYAEFARVFAGHMRAYLHDNEPLTQQFITDIRGALR